MKSKRSGFLFGNFLIKLQLYLTSLSYIHYTTNLRTSRAIEIFCLIVYIQHPNKKLIVFYNNLKFIRDKQKELLNAEEGIKRVFFNRNCNREKDREGSYDK